MEKQISKRTKLSDIAAVSIVLISTLLIIYMVKAEGEPGALPLFLITFGSVWLVVNKLRSSKKQETV